MSRPRASTTPQAARAKTPHRRGYHHGNLGEALIEATLGLIRQGGPEAVTVREVAKRAGVSSGAPFGLFSPRPALLPAVAEQAMAGFREEIVAALDQTDADDPLARFHALGTAYLRWASR